jgi:hypothetical protein
VLDGIQVTIKSIGALVQGVARAIGAMMGTIDEAIAETIKGLVAFLPTAAFELGRGGAAIIGALAAGILG